MFAITGFDCIINTMDYDNNKRVDLLHRLQIKFYFLLSSNFSYLFIISLGENYLISSEQERKLIQEVTKVKFHFYFLVLNLLLFPVFRLTFY